MPHAPVPSHQPHEAYRPTDGLLTWLYSLLPAAMVMYALRVVSTAWVMWRHPQIAQVTMTSEPPAHLVGPVMMVGCVSCIDLVLWIAWYAIFMVWVHRAATQARALDPRGAEFSPGVCTLGVAPVVNLVMSPVVMSDLLIAAEGNTKRGLRVSPLVLGWWGCLVGSLAVKLVAGFVTHPAAVGWIHLSLPLAFVQLGPGLAYLALTLVLVRRVHRALAGRTAAQYAAVYGREPEPWEM